MGKVFDFVPYKKCGGLHFGMHRDVVQKICGQKVSSCMYGYPVQDRFLDSYGFMHTLCNNQQLLEGVELFPDVSTEPLFLRYGKIEIELSKDPSALVHQLSQITDDLHPDDDGEGFTSIKLGLKIYCPDEIVEDVILHDPYCYEQEDAYIEEQNLK